MNIFVRYINKNTIKLSENGGLEIVVDSVTQNLLINDTTLRSFLPPKVCIMTSNYVIYVDVSFS